MARGRLDDAADVRIEIATAGIARSAQGTVAGPIWLAGPGGEAFPEVGWSDFPVVLLGAWIPSLRRLCDRQAAAECGFTDGQYHFTVSATDGAWRVACFEGRQGPSVANAVVEWNVDPGGFLASAVSAARAILGFCDSRHWWDADTERLRAAIEFADPDVGD